MELFVLFIQLDVWCGLDDKLWCIEVCNVVMLIWLG